MKVRTFFATLVAVLLGVSGAAALSSPSQAALVELTCTGSETVDYEPGLLLAPRVVTFDASVSYDSCSTLSGPAGYTGGASTPPGGISATLSCTNASTSSGTATIKWSDDVTSVYTFTSTSTTLAGQLITTQTGAITQGRFAGSDVTRVTTALELNLLACFTEPGITHREGTVVLTITSV